MLKETLPKRLSTLFSKETSVSVFDLDLKNLLLRMNSQKPSLTIKDLLLLALTIVALIDHFLFWDLVPSIGSLACNFLSLFHIWTNINP